MSIPLDVQVMAVPWFSCLGCQYQRYKKICIPPPNLSLQIQNWLSKCGWYENVFRFVKSVGLLYSGRKLNNRIPRVHSFFFLASAVAASELSPPSWPDDVILWNLWCCSFWVCIEDLWRFVELPSKPLSLDLMETLDLFFRRACYHWNTFYIKMKRIKFVVKLHIYKFGSVHFGTWFIQSYWTCKKKSKVSMRSKVRGFYGNYLVLLLVCSSHEQSSKSIKYGFLAFFLSVVIPTSRCALETGLKSAFLGREGIILSYWCL